MELTHNEVKNIIEIIDGAEHLDEVELVFAGFRLHVRRGGTADSGGARTMQAAPAGPAPAARSIAAAGASVGTAKTADAAVADDEVAIRAPMLGTFYRAPSPTAQAFVEVGQQVKADDNVCVIEVMKLFNTIRAGVDGTVVRIDAGNGSLVQYNQVMIVIAPTKKA